VAAGSSDGTIRLSDTATYATLADEPTGADDSILALSFTERISSSLATSQVS
jgi:hypothetical protein